jgi:hypothetical protein
MKSFLAGINGGSVIGRAARASLPEDPAAEGLTFATGGLILRMSVQYVTYLPK